MTAIIKKLVLFICFSTLLGGQICAQKILSIDTIYDLEPIVMYDTTDFFVSVSVNDTSAANQDSIYGDLFYWYQTDSMFVAGVPPRMINNDPSPEYIVGSKPDTVSIDIRPDEWRIGPVMVFILWPAMVNPEISDTVSIPFAKSLDGFLQLDNSFLSSKTNLVFPSPTIQFIKIRSVQLDLIRQVNIFSIEGKCMVNYDRTEFEQGTLNIDFLSPGNYFVELQYFDNSSTRTKIVKQ